MLEAEDKSFITLNAAEGLAAAPGYSGLALLGALPLNTSMTMAGAFMLLIRVRRLLALTLFARRFRAAR